jgi:hypothetical protein
LINGYDEIRNNCEYSMGRRDLKEFYNKDKVYNLEMQK